MITSVQLCLVPHGFERCPAVHPALHRLLERHGISRLPKDDSAKGERKRFKTYPIGFFHIDIAEVRCEDGKLFLYVAIDRTSKFAYAELHTEATRTVAAQMLANLIEAVPYRIHTVLTDDVLYQEAWIRYGNASPSTVCAVVEKYCE